MISHVRVFSLLYREKDGFLHTFHNTKREYSFSVHPMAVLPLFFYVFFLSVPYRIGKDRMDFRSRRRCGNVCTTACSGGAVGNLFAGCGKGLSFSMCCEWVFHRRKRQFSTFP